MPAITDAATLLIELKKSGTGESKLDLLRDLLTTNPDATAEEAINVLANAHHVTQRTVEKAMQLAEHGEVLPVRETKVLSVEERILERRKQAAVAGQKQEVLDQLATEKLAQIGASVPDQLATEKLAQIGASVPEDLVNQPSPVGPGKVETVRGPGKKTK